MTHFNQQFIDFFKSLSVNNNKDWFDENRKVYENEVKKPFAAFVDEMIDKIKDKEPDVQITAKDAVFRINNDIRFSKDKTPYKTHVAANISRFGRKDKTYPGFYFQLSDKSVLLAGGAYMVEPPKLLKIRNYMMQNHRQFKDAYQDKTFVQKFDKIQGEQHKRLDKSFQDFLEIEPLIANKQFYFMTELKPDILLKNNLTDLLMEYYHAGFPVNQFLKKSLS